DLVDQSQPDRPKAPAEQTPAERLCLDRRGHPSVERGRPALVYGDLRGSTAHPESRPHGLRAGSPARNRFASNSAPASSQNPAAPGPALWLPSRSSPPSAGSQSSRAGNADI